MEIKVQEFYFGRFNSLICFVSVEYVILPRLALIQKVLMSLDIFCFLPLQKAQRRRRSLKKGSDDVVGKGVKVNFAKALILDIMSSEEEKEDENVERYFERKVPSFRDKKF